ncbi:MAG: FtsX-like permease family protein [Bacteriovoracaceae bacterium]
MPWILEAQFNSIRLIILIIVILSILNSISTSILERKQELGNLRANGESVTDIMTLLISEGLVIGLIGSLVELF